MTPSKKANNKGSALGWLTHVAVYAVAVTAYYFWATPEITGTLTERQERDFHIAAVKLNKSNDADYVSFTLQSLKAGKADATSVSFLLPRDEVQFQAGGGHDLHRATVVERHPDWQLVKYHYGNSHDSVSQYRAFKGPHRTCFLPRHA
jgi:hypothetical protein